MIENEDILQKAIQVIKEEVGGFDHLGVGILFTIPIDSVIGLIENNSKWNKKPGK